MTDEFLETSFAARELGVSADGVRYLEARGRLQAVRTAGGKRLFARSEVERLKVERQTQREAEPLPKTA